MADHYLLIKSLHLIAVMSWMAGMLYLPRLYVYHADAKTGGELDEKLKIMEFKLLRYIINPAMIASLILGIMLAGILGKEGLGGWFHAKVALLVFMFGCHGMLARYRRHFAKGENKHSAKFYRILNEVPTVLMIAIVILAVMKPF
ncbi:MAG: TIGR00701 family protein [Alphaproteobacteria bacterium CG11_big_fil_rev_8_21_14_0_20_39_49]|nr:MAG: TIGR00701 family protein [Alphaproteobacteria bacterium CG11_big_fil_rev_8_21_14_0_20_39_49]